MFEIDVRYNRPLTDATRNYLNHFLDDEGIGLLRWRGDDEYVVLTFLVRHAERDGAVRPRDEPSSDVMAAPATGTNRSSSIAEAHHLSLGWWCETLDVATVGILCGQQRSGGVRTDSVDLHLSRVASGWLPEDRCQKAPSMPRRLRIGRARSAHANHHYEEDNRRCKHELRSGANTL